MCLQFGLKREILIKVNNNIHSNNKELFKKKQRADYDMYWYRETKSNFFNTFHVFNLLNNFHKKPKSWNQTVNYQRFHLIGFKYESGGLMINDKKKKKNTVHLAHQIWPKIFRKPNHEHAGSAFMKFTKSKKT